MTKRVAFIGLGVMGYPMAGHLCRAGYSVTVYNRTREVAERWVREAGVNLTIETEKKADPVNLLVKQADTPRAAAENADIVIACVGDDDDVRAVTLGDEGAFAGMGPGCVFVDHTTASAQLARELSEIARCNRCDYLDAPVSGGQAGAENGSLTVMVGGDENSFARVKDTIACYARAVTYLGSSGSGQLCKMVNQVCIAGLVQGLAEGLHFAQSSGLDVHKVVEVISQGAAQSWQMENRYETMLAGNYDHGFAVQWMRKDLAIVLNEARRNGSRLPVTALVDQFYGDVQAMGGNRWDTSSLLARLQALAEQPASQPASEGAC